MTLQEKLINKFGKEINHMSCVYLHNGEGVLRDMMKHVKDKVSALEIGTYNGVSACILAEYFDKVYTIDIEKQKLTDEIIDYAGDGKVITFIAKDRKHEIELVDSIKYDFVFIDGEHFHGELKKDYDMVKGCKYILVHDYSESFPEVWEFCNSLEGYDKKTGINFCLLIKKDEVKEVKKVKRGRAKKK
jgi:hypothetical protein